MSSILRDLRLAAGLSPDDVARRVADIDNVDASFRAQWVDDYRYFWEEMELDVWNWPESVDGVERASSIFGLSPDGRDKLYDASGILPPDVERTARPLVNWPLVRALDAIAHRATVTIDYTNWRGERSTRRIQPRGLTYESTEHHPEAQWTLHALCLEREDVRSFAVAGIHAWLTHAASEQK